MGRITGGDPGGDTPGDPRPGDSSSSSKGKSCPDLGRVIVNGRAPMGRPPGDFT